MNIDFDIAIIGGGINGAAIARDAALRGLKVILLEKTTLGAGASSKSSKLAHGGLRYLEQFSFGLVRTALQERALLIKNAPHLVRLIPFLLPHYKTNKRPQWWLSIGLSFYDLFSWKTAHHHKKLSTKEVIAAFPTLRQEGLSGGFRYYDGLMEDTQLVIANAAAAQERGATILTEAEVISVDETVHFNHQGELKTLRAHVIINATGAWSNEMKKRIVHPHTTTVFPTKGVHIVINTISPDTALLLETPQDKRFFFIIPWEGKSLVGTTDTPYHGDPDKVAPEESDITYLQDAVRHYFPDHDLTVLSAFAALRPLIQKVGTKPSIASREHVIEVTDFHSITVLGGKFTTHRAMAEEAVDAAVKLLARPCKPCSTKETPLV